MMMKDILIGVGLFAFVLVGIFLTVKEVKTNGKM